MLEELDSLACHLHENSNNRSYDMKIVKFVAQAILGSKVEQKFGITTEDIESSMLMMKQGLPNSDANIWGAMGKLFNITKDELQQVMQELIQSEQEMKGYMTDLKKDIVSKS